MFLFTQNIRYSLDGRKIEEHTFVSGESYAPDFVYSKLQESTVSSFLQSGVIIDTQLTQQQEQVADIQEITQQESEQQEQVFEPLYTVREPLQDKDGNEIPVDAQLTANELKDKGFVKLQQKKLLKEGKLIEIKIVK